MSEARHASFAPGLAGTPSRLMLPEGIPLIGWLVLSRIGWLVVRAVPNFL
jgi:hypothetical protein